MVEEGNGPQKEIVDFIKDTVCSEANSLFLTHSAIIAEKLADMQRSLDARMSAMDITKFHELRLRCTSILKECEEFRSMMAWYKKMENELTEIKRFNEKVRDMFHEYYN